MPAQLTLAEQSQVDRLVRVNKMAPLGALGKLNAERAKAGVQAVNKSTIYRFLNGKTHRRDVVEKRGSKKYLSKKDINKLDKVRKDLLKAADSRRRVSYEDIRNAAGLKERVCVRVVADALRQRGVRFRAPRSKVLLSADDAKVRLKVAKQWVRRPEKFWSDAVHAYVDNKAFPLPLTPQQRAKYEKTRVTGHLRTPAEGVSQGCTKPRMKHSFLGIPSVTISAAVARDRVIMWNVVAGAWNGHAAASMYKGPLLQALRKTWGTRRRYTIVEDGDRKGNTSGLGLAAKANVKIHAMTLPPRTPSWMPLDYAIWKAVEDKMQETAPKGSESKVAYLKRLEHCARSLPRVFVRKVIRRMKMNIRGVIEAKGYHAKND